MKSLRSNIALPALLVVVALVGIAVGRATVRSRAELRMAETHHQEGKPLVAIEHFRRTLRWSFPLSPFRGRAISGLESVAAELEEAEDRAGALRAWRSLVGGIAATRSMYSGADPATERAKDAIARLMALEGGAPIDANLSPDKVTADHRHLLTRDVSPHPLWGTVLLFGFALWIASLVLVINRGFDSAGKLRWPAVRVPASSALVGLLSFVVGLLLA